MEQSNTWSKYLAMPAARRKAVKPMVTAPTGANEPRPAALEQSLLAHLGGESTMTVEQLLELKDSDDPKIAQLATDALAARLTDEIEDRRDVRSTRHAVHRGLRVLVNTKAVATFVGLLLVVVVAGVSGYECVEGVLHDQAVVGAVFGAVTLGSGGGAVWMGRAVLRASRRTSGGPDGT